MDNLNVILKYGKSGEYQESARLAFGSKEKVNVLARLVNKLLVWWRGCRIREFFYQ